MPDVRPAAIMIYIDDWTNILEVTDSAQRGCLCDALVHYALTGEVPTVFSDPGTQLAFGFLRKKVDRDAQNYYFSVWQSRFAAAKKKSKSDIQFEEWLEQQVRREQSSDSLNTSGYTVEKGEVSGEDLLRVRDNLRQMSRLGGYGP